MTANSDWISFSNYCRSGVYVIYAARQGRRIPFYVGESAKIIARLGDYARASFEAPTDFKVGRTARLLEERNYDILVGIEWTLDRRTRERELIERHSDRPLLNRVQGYDYKTMSKDEYMAVLEKFVCENFSAT